MFTISGVHLADGTFRIWAAEWTRQGRYPAVAFQAEWEREAAFPTAIAAFEFMADAVKQFLQERHELDELYAEAVDDWPPL